MQSPSTDAGGRDAPGAEPLSASAESYGQRGAAVLVGLALIAIVAEIATRGLAPALPGVWVGAEHAITALKLVAAVTSQLFAVASAATVIALVLLTLRSGGPSSLRAFGVGVGVLTILAVMIASAVKLPEMSRMVLAGGSAALALACARVAARFYTSRAPALVLSAVALAGLVRMIAIILAGRASADKELALAVAARITATTSLVLVFGAVLVALLWMARTPSLGRRLTKRRWLVMVGVGALVFGLAVAAQLGSDPEASGTPLLVARIFEHLVARPQPYGPAIAFAVFEASRWLAALTLLLVAPRTRAMAAVVALALAAGGTLEIPLCAAALVVAALALPLHPGPDLRHDLPPRQPAPLGPGAKRFLPRLTKSSVASSKKPSKDQG